GNIGAHAVQALSEAPDLDLAGIVRRDPADRRGVPPEIPVVGDVRELGKVDGALLCGPTRAVPDLAVRYLELGINTVDSYDIHGELADVRSRYDAVAKRAGAVAVVSAGWDPGTDSMLRAMFEAMAPRGITYTNFGPGMSMGHSVAARAVDGVKDALSLTVPLGQGIHRRMVYVELEEGADFAEVEAAVRADPYFIKDETHVIQTADVKALIDVGHGVRLERKGVSGSTHNQFFQ